MKKFLCFYIKTLIVAWLFILLLAYYLGWMLTAFILFFLLFPMSIFSSKIIKFLAVLFKIDKNEYFLNMQFQHWIDIFLISLHIFFICLIIYYVRKNWDKR